MTYLADVNVLVALAVIGHTHHATASAWFEDSKDDEVALCRFTQAGFLRLLTNQRVMGENVVRPASAWEIYDVLLEDSRIGFISEPPGIEASWRAAARHPHTGPNFWTDAYLVAFAAAAGLDVVTFDRGFPRHENVQVRLLASPRRPT
jgi:toxin-antitoxin system PIN domain toxin